MPLEGIGVLQIPFLKKSEIFTLNEKMPKKYIYIFKNKTY